MFDVLTLSKGNALVLLIISWKMFTDTHLHGKFHDLAFRSWDRNQTSAFWIPHRTEIEKLWLL